MQGFNQQAGYSWAPLEVCQARQPLAGQSSKSQGRRRSKNSYLEEGLQTQVEAHERVLSSSREAFQQV